MGEMSKEERVAAILELLRPNTFTEESVVWESLKESLLKMTRTGLAELYVVLLCKHKDAEREVMVAKTCLGCGLEKPMLHHYGYCTTCKGEDED